MGNNHTKVYIEDTSKALYFDESFELIQSSNIENLPPSQEELLNFMKRKEMLDEALAYSKEKKYHKSLQIYKQMKTKFPNDYLPWVLEADILSQIETIKNHKELLIEKEHIRKSIPLYTKACELNPSSFDAWKKKAQCLALLKDYPEAVECYENAILNYGSEKMIYCFAMCLLFLTRYDESLFILDRLASIKQPDAIHHAHRATVLIEMGKYNDALKHLVNALNQKDNVPLLAYTSMTLLRLCQEDYESALTSINKAISMSFENGYLYGYKAFALLGLNDIINAKKAIDISLILDPNNYVGLLAKSKLLLEEKMYDESLIIIEELIEKKQGINKFCQNQLSSIIYQFKEATKIHGPKRRVFQGSSEIVRIKQTLKKIALRHGLYTTEEQEKGSNKIDTDQLKSNVRALQEILKSKLEDMENDMIKLLSMEDEIQKLNVK